MSNHSKQNIVHQAFQQNYYNVTLECRRFLFSILLVFDFWEIQEIPLGLIKILVNKKSFIKTSIYI